MNKIKPYTWIVRFDLAPEWVADGCMDRGHG